MWFICPDKCLDDYASPPIDNGKGDGFDVATGGETHGTETQGLCYPDAGVDEASEVSQEVQRQGTGNGVFKSIAKWTRTQDGSLRLSTSLQHPVGPFGMISLPTSVKHWCRWWGSAPNLVEFWSLPWSVLPRFSPTYVRFHLVIPIRASEGKTYRLTKPVDGQIQTLHYKFDISVTAGDGAGSPVSAGAALLALRYEFVGNSTPNVPNSGTVVSSGLYVSRFDRWREVNADTLDIELALWLPAEIYYPGTVVRVPEDELFGTSPGLVITIRKFELAYRVPGSV